MIMILVVLVVGDTGPAVCVFFYQLLIALDSGLEQHQLQNSLLIVLVIGCGCIVAVSSQ